MTNLLPIGPRDLEALEAIRTAMYACNAAESYRLQSQSGTYGQMYDAMVDAVAAIFFSQEVGRRLTRRIIDNGENVKYNLDIIRGEMCLCYGYSIT